MSAGTRVVVAGGTGFIGRSLVPLLAAQGCDVKLVGRSDWEAGTVVDVIDEFAPRVVVNLATHFLSAHVPQDIPPLIRANVEFGTLLAEGAHRAKARLVFASSAWQHVGGNDYDPVSLYAATKQAYSTIVEYYDRVLGLDTKEVTLFDTYGPGDTRRKLVPVLLECARTGAPAQMTDGLQLIDLTYVDDVAAGIALVALTDDVESSSVLRSWQAITIRELVRVAESAIGRQIPVQWGVRPARPREMNSDWVFGSSPKAWQRRISLADGLRKTWSAMDASAG